MKNKVFFFIQNWCRNWSSNFWNSIKTDMKNSHTFSVAPVQSVKSQNASHSSRNPHILHIRKLKSFSTVVSPKNEKKTASGYLIYGLQKKKTHFDLPKSWTCFRSSIFIFFLAGAKIESACRFLLSRDIERSNAFNFWKKKRDKILMNQ